MPTPAWIEGETECLVMKKSVTVDFQRRHNRYFKIGKFRAELVLFEDLVVRPTLWTIKLGDQWVFAAPFQAHLINAIFVTVEWINAGIAGEAETFHCSQD